MLQILAEALLLATRQSGAIHRQPTCGVTPKAGVFDTQSWSSAKRK